MKLLQGRLIAVSNRLPVEIKSRGGQPRLSPSAGGLATALDSVWRFCHGVWIGWAGAAGSEIAQRLLDKAARGRSFDFRAIPLSREEIAKFYSGFANEIIWPLFHDMPSRCDFDPDSWEVYQRVNRRFAQAAVDSANGKDLVWVHDYHLMLTGHYIREIRPDARVGFFLHIPFPTPDIFEKLPWRKPILRGLLQYDLLGFQADRDRYNFLNCVERILPQATALQNGPYHMLRLDGRRTRVGTFPVSVAFDQFANHAASHDIEVAANQLRQELGHKFVVLGVDRMDYTKGIPERLKAFRLLLRRLPDLRHRVTLLQIVVPSREEIPNYKELRREVELLVSQINGEFTESGWVPIHYIHRKLTRKQLVTYYRAADIALVTSLKDGMNLIAKEFCAAQVDEEGVVVISEFAGASAELEHGAIVVNPNDLAGVAEAIHRACVMPIEEKRSRMRLLREIVRTYTVQHWAEAFLRAALTTETPAEGTIPSSGGEGANLPFIAAAGLHHRRSA